MPPQRSLWWSTLPASPTPRASLDGDLDVDVAVVGAGFTGLWTAWHLLAARPGLRVAVLEAEVAGFGASGRNGGWASALYPKELDLLARHHGDGVARRLVGILREAVRELGATIGAEGIDADYRRGGTLTLARSEPQLARLMEDLESARARGDTEDDLAWLGAPEAAARCAAAGTLGALYTPHCAAIHPAKLARGLADAVERRGGHLYEGTAVTRIVAATESRRARCVTRHGAVTADVVVRATEGYTPRLPGSRREVVPLYSLMVATSPLPAAFFERVGLASRETFTDRRHLIIYGQRTADDRLAFGGRGAPYHLGSRVDAGFEDEPRVFSRLAETLEELFGELGGEVTHRWGGPLGVARDRSPFVRLDRTSGLAAAGGYVGDGVVMSFVAGRALAHLIVDEPDPAEGLPFVGHRARDWEPEPIRWLGITAAMRAAELADRHEARRGTPSRASGALERLIG